MGKSFVAVQDTHRKRIRGLWKRGEKTLSRGEPAGEKTPRKFPLEAASVSETKAAMEAKRTDLRIGNYLRVLELTERATQGDGGSMPIRTTLA
jgi:hypothetical protein